jgi:hypothetical protein
MFEMEGNGGIASFPWTSLARMQNILRMERPWHAKYFVVWNGPHQGRSMQRNILHALHQISYIGD